MRRLNIIATDLMLRPKHERVLVRPFIPGEPTLIVRVYDLSDLFSIAPAYASVIGNDLGLAPRSLFPEAAVPHTGGQTTGM